MHRMASLWNSLTEDVIETQNKKALKSILDSFCVFLNLENNGSPRKNAVKNEKNNGIIQTKGSTKLLCAPANKFFTFDMDLIPPCMKRDGYAVAFFRRSGKLNTPPTPAAESRRRQLRAREP